MTNNDEQKWELRTANDTGTTQQHNSSIIIQYTYLFPR